MTTPGLKELRKNLDAILKKEKAEEKKPSRGFSTKVEHIIYGADKKIDFANFNGGDVVKAIAGDLEEFGQKGVQGVRVADETAFISYNKARRDLKAPYLQAGVVNGTLVLLLRDEEANVEAMHVLVKDYVKLKEKLKKSSASVTNIDPDGDPIISRSVERTARKLGTSVNADPNFGEITGNIVLTAHGTPDTMPSGRVVGVELGEKTPADIVKMLTSDKDPKKRVGKDYDGTLTLCGCFTASGGPEAEKQDDAFAKKVLDLFRKKGYKKISVVGYPGATITAKGAGTDSHGTAVTEGDEMVEARPSTGAQLDRQDELEDAAEKALKKYNDLVDEYNAANDEFNKARKAMQKAIKDSGLSQKAYLKTDEGKAGFKKYQALEATKKKLDKESDDAKAAMKKAEKALKDSGFGDTWARLEGRFGLRVIN